MVDDFSGVLAVVNIVPPAYRLETVRKLKTVLNGFDIPHQNNVVADPQFSVLDEGEEPSFQLQLTYYFNAKSLTAKQRKALNEAFGWNL